MRSFITGVDGFIGAHLARHLASRGDVVAGLTRRSPDAVSVDTGGGSVVRRFPGSVEDAGAVLAAVREFAPERVFHLAARCNLAQSFREPEATLRTNVFGTLNLLEAVRAAAPKAAFVSVGSSAEYGLSAHASDHVGEDAALRPSSPFGVSKVAQGQLAQLYARTYGLRAVHVRPFAIIGPGKQGDALADFCHGTVSVERGEAAEFLTGRLDAVRDFVDVRDCVRALVLVSERGETATEYNVCTGLGRTLGDVITALRGLATRPLATRPDPTRARPLDDPRIVGDPRRLAALGFRPDYELADTVRATLDYWRAR